MKKYNRELTLEEIRFRWLRLLIGTVFEVSKDEICLFQFKNEINVEIRRKCEILFFKTKNKEFCRLLKLFGFKCELLSVEPSHRWVVYLG